METIGDHFSGDEDFLSLLTDGELKRKSVGDYNWNPLIRAALAAVKERSPLPFLGRKSLGDLCGRTMEILRSVDNTNAPKCWIPIMKTLRAGGPSIVRPYVEMTEADMRRHEADVDRQVREAFPEYKNAPK